MVTVATKRRRREPTADQKEAAAKRRAAMRAIAERIGEMTEEQRAELAARAGIRTIEGRPLSVFNCCMVWNQDEGASVVGGFRQWLNAGRCVRKGARGLAIWIPIGKDAEESAPAVEGEKPGGVRFCLGTVFDIAQTEPTDGPREPEPARDERPAPALVRASLFLNAPEPAPVKPQDGGKLRALAEPLTAKIERLRGNRQENTPKRQAQGMSARCEANNLERVQRALLALADGWDAGTVPASLRGLRTRAAIEPLVTKIIDHPSYYVVCESDKYRDNGSQAVALREFVKAAGAAQFAEVDAENAKRARVRALEEQIRFVPIQGFFPTPPDLVESMLSAADLCPGLSVLDPGAGKGDLLEAADAAGCDAAGFEIVPALANLCQAKGLNVVQDDFTTIEPSASYDRVLMNPPFERLQDAAHVRRAYDWLKPGGRLVAIVSASVMFNRQAQEFRDWLESVDHTIEDNDPDAFKGAFRSTGVSTKLLVITRGEA